ncbi:hypothetical protein NQ314_016588 [Rhamnusium bicolor]|uniref:Uncharacterized protein n=1 Tax=Rhamnusium bicolor TaxID=1586634 RepID=A0AAV8WWF0_9CUCU|nr:hypothetical protein NQ314_016588 [Rhamnusium bicolor]
MQELVYFDEHDELESNESLVELTPEIAALLPQSDSSTISFESFRKELSPTCKNIDVERSDVVEVAENFVKKLMEISATSVNHTLFKDVINEAKGNLCQETVGESGALHNNKSSKDEGMEDCTLTNETVIKSASLNTSVDENVVKMSNLIFDYLVQQCFEVKELVLFPEVLHDSNINKLLGKLLLLYEECYANLNKRRKII